jgi:hypothetical protein
MLTKNRRFTHCPVLSVIGTGNAFTNESSLTVFNRARDLRLRTFGAWMTLNRDWSLLTGHPEVAQLLPDCRLLVQKVSQERVVDENSQD